MTDSLTTWRERNPLRAWRRRTNNTRSQAATLVGCTDQAVYYWEAGERTPQPAWMARIAIVTRTADMQRRWYRWLADRP